MDLLLFLLPTLVGDHSDTFFDRNQLVNWDLSPLLVHTIGPIHFNLGDIRLAEAEVESRVVTGVVTRLAEYSLRLHLSAVVHEYARPDRAPVGLDSLQLHLEPVGLSFQIVA